MRGNSMKFLDNLKARFGRNDIELPPEIGPQLTKPVSVESELTSAAISPPLTVMTARTFPKADTDAAFDIQASSIARFQQNTFNPYSYSTFRNLYTYDERSFYADYEESYMQNPFTQMVIEYLMNETFANDYHFEGPGAKVVEDFFSLDNTRDKIKMAWRETLKKGNGFMDITLKGSKLIRTRVLPTETITITLDSKTGERIYMQSYLGKTTYLKPEYFIHFTVRDAVNRAYAVSLLRSNYVFLTALMDVGGDIMAALKRVAYAPIVANLDMEGLTDEEKKTKLADWKKKLAEMESATQNFAIDKRHTLELLGSGGGGARLLPTNDLIAPIISVVLINFGIPLGMFLQTGANKSIIEEQRQAMQRFYEDMRNKIKLFVEQKILINITGRNTQLVFNKPPLTDTSVQKAFELEMNAVIGGILSPDYFKEHWDIIDTGTPIFPTVPTSKTIKPKIKPKAKGIEDETDSGE
jgi:hypothetical protein